LRWLNSFGAPIKNAMARIWGGVLIGNDIDGELSKVITVLQVV
jgi:hypothetical protein